jgi:hypothetical protein
MVKFYPSKILIKILINLLKPIKIVLKFIDLRSFIIDYVT